MIVKVNEFDGSGKFRVSVLGLKIVNLIKNGKTKTIMDSDGEVVKN